VQSINFSSAQRLQLLNSGVGVDAFAEGKQEVLLMLQSGTWVDYNMRKDKEKRKQRMVSRIKV
jgi:hypothetical protein